MKKYLLSLLLLVSPFIFTSSAFADVNYIHITGFNPTSHTITFTTVNPVTGCDGGVEFFEAKNGSGLDSQSAFNDTSDLSCTGTSITNSGFAFSSGDYNSIALDMRDSGTSGNIWTSDSWFTYVPSTPSVPEADSTVVSSTSALISGFQESVLGRLLLLIPIGAGLLITIAIVYFVIRKSKKIMLVDSGGSVIKKGGFYYHNGGPKRTIYKKNGFYFHGSKPSTTVYKQKGTGFYFHGGLPMPRG